MNWFYRRASQIGWWISQSALVRPVALLCGLLSLPVSALADCSLERIAQVPLISASRPVIDVSINGQRIPMVVDTGAQMTSVTPELAAQLGLVADPRRRTLSRSVGGTQQSWNAIVERLDVPGVILIDQSVPVVALSGSDKDSQVGGIVGADILEDFDVELDVPNRALTLYQKQKCVPTRAPWDGPSQTVAGRIVDHRFLFPVYLNGLPVTAQFDTGSLGETVSRTSAERIGITATQLDSDPLSEGTSAGRRRYVIHRHRFDTFKVGDEMFHGARLDVADFEQPDIDMLVGVDYMHWRRFFLSYSSGLLFIQREPDEKIRQELKLFKREGSS